MKSMFVGFKDGARSDVLKALNKLEGVTGVSKNDTGIRIEYTGSHEKIVEVMSLLDVVNVVEDQRDAGEEDEPLFPYMWNHRFMGIDYESAQALRSSGLAPRNKVKVAVIDSGYRPTHPDSPETTHTQSLVPGEAVTDTGSQHSHGTHVLTSIASPRNSIGIAGILANFGIDYEVYVYKMFSSSGSSSGNYWTALQDCVSRGVDVVNMSFGHASWLVDSTGSPLSGGCEVGSNSLTADKTVTSLDANFGLLYQNGLIPVISAGNSYISGPTSAQYPRGAGEEIQSGIFVPPQDCLGSPAIYSQTNPGVVSVGAAARDGSRAYYSQKGKGLKVSAYVGGANVTPEFTGFPNTALAGSTTSGQDSYVFMQGTSMAAPLITAVIGVIIGTGAANVNQCASSSDVDKILTKLYHGNSNHDLPSPSSDFGWGIFNSSWL